MSRLAAAIALALALTLAPVHAGAPAPAHAEAGLSFAVVGDAPYSNGEEWLFADMLKDIDREELAFVVHVGDFKSSNSPCTDELFARRLRQFQSLRHAFIFVPGDNEWTDCHRSGADPLERLAKLREMFYPDAYSLGHLKLRLERQSADARYAEFRENVRWSVGPLLFIGLNLPGSNNNLGRTALMDAEYARRSAANAAWMAQGFELSKHRGQSAVFIAVQADPHFERPYRRPPEAADGYARFREELLAHTLDFGKPVILIHGDGHRYRVDHPLVDPATQKAVVNFTRIETYGSPWVEWLRVSVDPADPSKLVIRTGKEINPVQ